MSVSIKKVETVYHETGEGQQPRTDVEYVLGGEIDGVFVPFVTVQSGRVDMYKARAEAEKAKNPPAEKPAKPSGDESQ
jgi:hypothetical protein